MSDFLKKASGAVFGEGGGLSGLQDQVLGQVGGLRGLVEKFKQNGLGDTVNSWIGTGENKSISPDQVQQGLGLENLTAMAEKIGIPVDMLKQKLAEFLPGVVDKMTPEGKLPA